MKRLWSVILIVMLAAALPLRVFAMPFSACCAAGMSTELAPVTQTEATQVDSGHSCGAHSDCSAKGNPTQMSHASCTAICAAVGGVPIPVSLAGATRVCVLVAHPESGFHSAVLALLERPPKTFSV